ncbi:hypothetical protein V8095_003600 [Vibrio parahaemolyticus]
MKLKQSTLDAIKHLGKIYQGIIIHEGKQLRAQDNLNRFLAYVEIEDSMPKTFGVYDTDEFLKAIKLVHDAELTFEDNYVLISNKEQAELIYQYANVEFITEPPPKFNFPDEEDETESEFKIRIEKYEAEKRDYDEEKKQYDEDYKEFLDNRNQYNKDLSEYRATLSNRSEEEIESELDSFVEDLNSDNQKKTVTEPVEPTQPKKPVEPRKPVRHITHKCFIEYDVIDQVVKVAKTLGLDGVRIYSEKGSKSVYISNTCLKDSSKHSFKIPFDVNSTDTEFSYTFKMERFELIYKGDYEVTIHGAGISRFKNDTHTYYITTEAV